MHGNVLFNAKGGRIKGTVYNGLRMKILQFQLILYKILDSIKSITYISLRTRYI